ncbi:2-dehydropantoate 2-reductase [Photobacterium sp. GJ3]|uniref:2-dehydropantoate 2-reductase n=1 Tax=Photobacterium sp. GJ3 TaxID=2829502 RepID=UPI001B8BC53C|nr:2-dehydropantoate 2-reductase [Photobacterium sp. GJ3]QUJ66777.1 2-dehydropantoate 2-reductase [Photobacterium sp. GJ3]
MNITLVGAGAVGCLWAGALAKQGHQVHLWRRQPGTHFTLNWQGLDTAIPDTFTLPCNQSSLLASSDGVLITVKAFQVSEAVASIQPFLKPQTPVIVMHNGMGTESHVLKQLPGHPVLYATTAQAAFRPDPFSVRHTGMGPTHLGGVNPAGQACAQFSDIFHDALSPCHWHTDIHLPQWQKLAINCAINPLTAIHQCRNGELADRHFAEPLMAICDEVAAVMRAAGYPAETESLLQQVYTVINATAANYSSMQQDVAHQRQTEIDAITGFLIAQATSFQIATPTNQQLWQQIKQLEQEYG